MVGQNLIESLKDKHAKLEQAIAAENGRPLPNELHIQELKRQKLRIKDEIMRMTAH